MKRILFMFAVILIGAAVFYLLYTYNTQRIIQDSVYASMEATSDSVMMNNFDSSKRVTLDALSIQSFEKYEEEFIADFENNNTFNTKLKTIKYSFDYLVINPHGHHVHVDNTYQLTDKDIVKGVNNRVEIDGVNYTIRMIVDQKGGNDGN